MKDPDKSSSVDVKPKERFGPDTSPKDFFGIDLDKQEEKVENYFKTFPATSNEGKVRDINLCICW